MGQVHKRFSGEQVAFLLQAYSQGLITRFEVLEVLEIAKTRFFALREECRRNPEAVALSYQHTSPRRSSPEAEAVIEGVAFTTASAGDLTPALHSAYNPV
jgi:hypothetical protein